jgi:septum formation topological specificity factor MinE
MTKNNNFSETIQTLMMNEINAVIRKYSNIETKKLEYVEILLSKIDDNKLKQELLQDFDNVIKLSTEIENNNVDSNIIRAYLWIKNNMQLDITLNSVAEEFK